MSRQSTAKDQIGITDPISPESQPWNLAVTRGDTANATCRRGESNPYVLSDRRV
jgi:hypothetical protein